MRSYWPPGKMPGGEVSILTPDACRLREEDSMSVEELRRSPMMSHLLDALGKGKDIGHYGRLTFAMVGRYFLKPQELEQWLAKGGGTSEEDAKALVAEVEGRDYNPPSRRQILQWQGQQDFPICPDPADPDACNVYQDLQFPEGVYDDIKQYRAQQFDAEASGRR
jgi:hypothetical protein